ncbi:MAG: ATP-dependent zinc metalloprotease FtsH [Ilumatobacteraceae bacterium]
MASRERHHRRPSRLPPPPGTEPTWRTEGAPESGEPAHRRHWLKPSRLLWVIAAAVVGNLLIVSLLSDGEGRVEVAYSVFAAQVEADNVAVVTSTGDAISGEFREAIVDPEDAADAEPTVVSFTTQRPAFADDDLIAVLVANGVEVRAEPESTGTSWFLALLVNLGPALLLIGGYVWLMRRAGGLGGLGTLGRSRAVRSDTSGRRTTFADVAGIDEATEELVEVVDFLRNPDRYRTIGARAPRGVLLMGPPGTGKTLLARAVAGEANVPFFSMSASEFIEMIVGVGASRVRDLFDKAKAVAPSIIFIDELDAIGRARGSVASFGGVDEREQTLNQILTEMDGFTGNEGVIVLAATNRPDVLDPALLRPGRFDRRVVLNPPDQKGRAAILRVHTRKVPLSVDTDLEVIASTTPGMVGADLANLVNEAALMAARRQHEVVTPSDFADALERIVLGAERRIMLSDEERRRTAYHEAGHALLGMLEQGADPVRKVSIIPRGRSLGVTFQSPTSDRYGMSEVYLRGRIVGALGGRAAEEVVFGDTTTGAESDLEQVTAIARQMVGRWGMSEAVGPITVLPAPGADVGFGLMDPSAPAEATRQLVDAEVRAIVDECYGRAVELVRTNRERLDKVAAALLAHETLDEAEVYAAAGVAPPSHS